MNYFKMENTERYRRNNRHESLKETMNNKGNMVTQLHEQPYNYLILQLIKVGKTQEESRPQETISV